MRLPSALFFFLFLRGCTFSASNMRPREATGPRVRIMSRLTFQFKQFRDSQPQNSQRLFKCISLKDNHHNGSETDLSLQGIQCMCVCGARCVVYNLVCDILFGYSHSLTTQSLCIVQGDETLNCGVFYCCNASPLCKSPVKHQSCILVFFFWPLGCKHPTYYHIIFYRLSRIARERVKRKSLGRRISISSVFLSK